jgi:hypothetical protein
MVKLFSLFLIVSSLGFAQAHSNSLSWLESQGLGGGTYTSGGSISGTVGQTCVLSGFNGVTGATATIALTGTNVIASGIPITVTASGTGGVAAPSGAALSNGSATCSGTASIAGVLTDPAQGFLVLRGTVSGGPYTTIGTINSPNILSYVDSTVVAGNVFYYVVEATSNGTSSGPSNEVRCTTPFGIPAPPTSLKGNAN